MRFRIWIISKVLLWGIVISTAVLVVASADIIWKGNLTFFVDVPAEASIGMAVRAGGLVCSRTTLKMKAVFFHSKKCELSELFELLVGERLKKFKKFIGLHYFLIFTLTDTFEEHRVIDEALHGTYRQTYLLCFVVCLLCLEFLR